MVLTAAALLATLLPVHQPPCASPPMTRGGPAGRCRLARWTFAEDGTPGRTVAVPHAANVPGSGRAAARSAWRGDVGWYRTHVDVPRPGRYELAFGAAGFRADVHVDGRRVGGHVGPDTAFTVRPVLTAGRHEVAVRVDWRSPSAQSRAGFHRTWYAWGGLTREVTIRPLGAGDVRDVRVDTTLRPDGRARVAVSARIDELSGRARRVPVVIALGAGRRVLGPVALPALGTVTVRRTYVVPPTALWEPGRPRLHDLRVGVPGESAHTSRVGFRELRVRDGRLELNGRPFVARGAALHEEVAGRGGALHARDLDALVAELAALGANATRAQHVLPAALYERLDRAGILVWQHVGPVDSPGDWRAGRSPAALALATRRVRYDVVAVRRHPSVAALGLGVEVAGNGRPGQAAWISARARELDRTDPGRPVGVDVWGDRLPERPGLLHRDLDWVGTTDYLGWYERPRAGRAELERAIAARVQRFLARLPGKAVLVTEFGAEGSALNAPARRGGTRAQAALLALHLRVYARVAGLDGALAWVLRDFRVDPAFGGGSIARLDRTIRFAPGHNHKGLSTAAGRPKPAAAAVRDGLARLGSGP